MCFRQESVQRATPPPRWSFLFAQSPTRRIEVHGEVGDVAGEVVVGVLEPAGPIRNPVQAPAEFAHRGIQVFDGAIDSLRHHFLHSRETNSASHFLAAEAMTRSEACAVFAEARISSGDAVDQCCS